ncbi:purine and uridine phosphorylase [Penicillium malachiteum]|uniref:purine and uridine phosphorylase n=1 Tax=Penicillium malachiteum TaxID=1324776 RepID=UPI0025475E45|nr:purine and uridine phosphorylase [Penicillium malachiteum]KAJ5726051.1 purine and uridine phosphorylase [Penicillium malachiteum]
MGELGINGDVQLKGMLNAPPRPILTALTELKASALVDDPCFPQFIEKATGRNGRTKKTFGRPQADQDRLFQAQYEHIEGTSCNDCPTKWESKRIARDTSEPETHYGIIASGNCVIKHAATRDRLGAKTGALCFEMESSGLMMDFPCKLIRGICDYSDSHKNDKWQGYAALSAAAYAKELLGNVAVAQIAQERLVVEVCKDLKKEIKTIRDISKGTQAGIESIQSAQYLKHIQEWLLPSDISINFNAALEARQEGGMLLVSPKRVIL